MERHGVGKVQEGRERGMERGDERRREGGRKSVSCGYIETEYQGKHGVRSESHRLCAHGMK